MQAELALCMAPAAATSAPTPTLYAIAAKNISNLATPEALMYMDGPSGTYITNTAHPLNGSDGVLMPACFVVVPSVQRAVLCTLTPQNHFCIIIISSVNGTTLHRSCTNTILVGGQRRYHTYALYFHAVTCLSPSRVLWCCRPTTWC